VDLAFPAARVALDLQGAAGADAVEDSAKAACLELQGWRLRTLRVADWQHLGRLERLQLLAGLTADLEARTPAGGQNAPQGHQASNRRASASARGRGD
jgi:very-short-patch-repair endonuclease